MSAPTAPKPANLAKTASAECSAVLWRRLTERELNRFESVAEVASSPDLRAEAERTLPALQAHAAPCGPKAVVGMLVPLVSVFGVADKSEAEWATFWGIYIDVLGHLPAEALRRGIDAYVAKSDSEFFPKPGPLLALCEPFANPILDAAHRAEVATTAKTPGEIGDADEWRYRDYLQSVSADIRRKRLTG